VSGNDFSLFENACALLCPHAPRNRARHRVGNRPALGELHNVILQRVVADARENCGLHPPRTERQQAGRCAASHGITDHVHGIQVEVIEESGDVAGVRGVFVSASFAWLVGGSEAPHIRHNGAGPGSEECTCQSRPAFRRGVGKGRRSSKCLAEHRLPLFQPWQDPFELTELAESVDPETMEQDHGGAVSLVRVGDAGSVEGSECVHMRRRYGVWDSVRDLNRVAELTEYGCKAGWGRSPA
jgi:hypothetical protein